MPAKVDGSQAMVIKGETKLTTPFSMESIRKINKCLDLKNSIYPIGRIVSIRIMLPGFNPELDTNQLSRRT